MSCPDCLSGAILAGTPKGITNKDGSYLAPAPEGSESKRAVLVLTDVFGLALNNPKLIADHLSEKMQCDVWVPDMFNGMYHSKLLLLISLYYKLLMCLNRR